MWLLIGSFLILLIIGVPVALSMAVSSLIYVLVDGNMADFAVLHRMIGGVDSFPLLAVPFFILAGNLMNIAGVTNRIYQFAVHAVGWMRGGLGQVNIIGSVIFSGMSGTAIADAAGLGTIEIKAMKDHGYPLDFSVGVTAASATLGPIIPPSLPFVIYGMMANVSIGALFVGGILPGLVMTVMMMMTVAYFARRNKWGADSPFSWPQMFRSGLEVAVVFLAGGAIWGIYAITDWPLLIGAFFVIAILTWADWYFKFSAVMALMTPMLLIGGMTAGLFTPTEAAVAACAWALYLGLFRYRTMTFKSVAKATFETVETTASVLFIVSSAAIFGWLLTATKVADVLTNAFLALTDQRWVFLILVNILILIVGSFIDTLAAITILVPILMPLLLKFGVDPIHFGVVITLNLMIGLLHPPLGMVLYVLARVARMSVEATTMAILPWLVPLMLALGIITFVPDITLWLPKMIMK
jgi:TRAP-type C4-dicarboxylate transport system permease large subunit